MRRRDLMKASFLLPLFNWCDRSARWRQAARQRAIFLYFPDGVLGPRKTATPACGMRAARRRSSRWAAAGSARGLKDQCVFFNGLSMGPTDAGSHPAVPRSC